MQSISPKRLHAGRSVAMMPDPAVNTDVPAAALRAESPVSFVR
jgi:hypothetical protein